MFSTTEGNEPEDYIRDNNFLRSSISCLGCTNLIHLIGIRAHTDLKWIAADVTDPH